MKVILCKEEKSLSFFAIDNVKHHTNVPIYNIAKMELDPSNKFALIYFVWTDVEKITHSLVERISTDTYSQILQYLPKGEDFKNNILQDDETETGGISFIGETLEDFLLETDTPFNTPMYEVNQYLKQCGIKPIKCSFSIHDFFMKKNKKA